MITGLLARPDGLHVKVDVAGYRGMLAAHPAGRSGLAGTPIPRSGRRGYAPSGNATCPGLSDLGYRLRQLRQAADLPQQQVAAALECSTSKLSRIETGEILATTRDVRDLADLYRAHPRERDALVAAARAARPLCTAWALRRQRQLHDDQDGAR